MLTLVPTRAAAQTAYVRFDITAIGDTTFTFSTAGVHWVKRSQSGLVVDPTHADELIAKFVVSRSRKGSAVGLVTGQTGRINMNYVALIKEPHHAFFTRPWFWLGVAAGGIIGWGIHH
jgi:hypothetical protein